MGQPPLHLSLGTRDLRHEPPVLARVNGTDRTSFPYCARLEDDAIRACRADHTLPARRGLRYAVNCTLTALALL
ncbi:hypothetical protein EDD94_7998 [Streptomyces sp. PanSC9]|nr:hypothetical protein EDD94_7998 [Streptomyces sp. PanSC9]